MPRCTDAAIGRGLAFVETSPTPNARQTSPSMRERPCLQW